MNAKDPRYRKKHFRGGSGGARTSVMNRVHPSVNKGSSQYRSYRKSARAKHVDAVVGSRVSADREKRQMGAFRRQSRLAHLGSMFQDSMGHQGGPLALLGRSLYNLYGTPMQVDRPNFDVFYNDLWKRASRFYGQQGKPPPGYGVQAGSGNPSGGLNWVGLTMPTGKYPNDRGQRPIFFDPSIVNKIGEYQRPQFEALSGRYPGDTAFDKAVPVHEWVHEFQGDKAFRARPGAEQGAEGLTYLIAPGLIPGYKRRQRKDPYDRFARQGIRRGANWLYHGQFH